MRRVGNGGALLSVFLLHGLLCLCSYESTVGAVDGRVVLHTADIFAISEGDCALPARASINIARKIEANKLFEFEHGQTPHLRHEMVVVCVSAFTFLVLATLLGFDYSPATAILSKPARSRV
jgi:hypothetical protein